MKHIKRILFLLFLNNWGIAQNKLGLTEKEIINIYGYNDKSWITSKGDKAITIIYDEISYSFVFDEKGLCKLEIQKPLNDNSKDRLLKYVKSHQEVQNTWIICKSCKTNLGIGEIIALYIPQEEYVIFVNPNQLGIFLTKKTKEDIKQRQSNNISNTNANWRILQYDIINFPKSDEYDAYQVLDFAKKIKFKPKYISFATLEKAILYLNPSDMKQLNITAIYYCEQRNSSTKSRYFEQYGTVPDNIFGKYCTLFHILMSIDDAGR